MRSDEERQLATCIEESLLIAKAGELNLLSVVSQWRYHIGIPKDSIKEELNIATAFIMKNYSNFMTLAEVELAYNLAVTKNIENVEFNGYFSPEYIGKVLKSYLNYRTAKLMDAVRAKQKHESELEDAKNKPTPEQQCERYKILIRDFYNEYKETGEVRDVLNICYRYFRQVKFLLVPQELLDEATAYGKKRAKEIIESEKTGYKWNNTIEEHRYARNYCVQKYFETVDIDVLINNIKAEHFS